MTGYPPDRTEQATACQPRPDPDPRADLEPYAPPGGFYDPAADPGFATWGGRLPGPEAG